MKGPATAAAQVTGASTSGEDPGGTIPAPGAAAAPTPPAKDGKEPHGRDGSGAPSTTQDVMNMLLPLPGVLFLSSTSVVTLAPSTGVDSLLPLPDGERNTGTIEYCASNHDARTTWPEVINRRNLG